MDKEFKVNGYFYNVELDNGETLPMRSLLEIRNIKSKSTKIDALVIMMNPGSSSPVQVKKIESFTQKNVCKELERRFGKCGIDTVLYEAKPDETQYQIMRVMKRQEWKYVRVINLSDIREPKSHIFRKKLKSELLDFHEHSIFSTERKQELEMLMGNDISIPIICAWGVNEELSILARQCIELLPKENVIGYKKKEHLYYHPYQYSREKSEEWVDNICRQIK